MKMLLRRRHSTAFIFLHFSDPPLRLTRDSERKGPHKLESWIAVRRGFEVGEKFGPTSNSILPFACEFLRDRTAWRLTKNTFGFNCHRGVPAWAPPFGSPVAQALLAPTHRKEFADYLLRELEPRAVPCNIFLFRRQ